MERIVGVKRTVWMVTLSEASRRLDVDRQLIRFVLKQNQIPYRQVGGAKVLDPEGFGRLRRAIEAYLSLPDTLVDIPEPALNRCATSIVA